MRRGALLLASLAAVAACELNPPGTCTTRADCAAGLECVAGICSACRSDLDCEPWQGCGLDGLCAPRTERCAIEKSCCGTDGTVPCCATDADCESWEQCDADLTHTCSLRPGPGFCADDTGCTVANTLCDPVHRCSLVDGWCAVDADCNGWLGGTGVCDTTQRCTLPAVAGEDVLMIGTLVEGACDRGAISRATTAAAKVLATVEIGLGCGSAPDGRAWMDPWTGGVVYRHAEAVGGDLLRRFRKDDLTWDAAAGVQRFPADASANDDVALVPAKCPFAWDRWAMQAATGSLMYACPVGGEPLQRDFYDDAGARKLQAVRELLSWNDGGYLLVQNGAGALRVVDGGGLATAVSSLPAGIQLAWRATATGFRVALRSDVTGSDELWEIAALTGQATLAGTYAAELAGFMGHAWVVLDAAGALYGGAFLGTREVLMKRPLAPGTTTVVYDEASMPSGSNDFGVDPFKPFVRLDRFLLVTRP